MKRKRIYLITILFLGIIIIFSIFFKSPKEQEQEQKQKITEQYEQVSLEQDTKENIVKSYQEQFSNSDIIGELSITNTDLKVPIAQAKDNEYYLNHLLDKSYNQLGSVFLDYRNQVTDKKIIIYGHNSKEVNTEFHILENYLQKDYYQNHSTILFQTEREKFNYKIFSIYIADTNYQHVNLKFDSNSYQEHINWLKQQSIYDTGVSVDSNDDIIVLQTCYLTKDNSYIIIVGKKE